jgi:hypothetical protein
MRIGTCFVFATGSTFCNLGQVKPQDMQLQPLPYPSPSSTMALKVSSSRLQQIQTMHGGAAAPVGTLCCAMLCHTAAGYVMIVLNSL